MNIQISIIIANRNGGAFLKENIESIYQERANNFEVIIVDDASEDDSVSVIKQAMPKKHLSLLSFDLQQGAAACRNAGVEKSNGEFLFFLDSDTTLAPGWSQKIPEFFSQYNNAGMAQVKILTKGSQLFDYAGDYMSSIGFLIERARNAPDTGQFDTTVPIFSGKSAAMLARKDVFKKVDGFDTDYIIFLEDTDIMWRCRLYGYDVYYYPSVTVYHAYGTKDKNFTFYINNKVHERGCRNTIITHIKNWSPARLLYILPIQILTWSILGTAMIIKGDFFKGSSIFKGLCSVLFSLKQTIQKRNIIQKKRTVSDNTLMQTVGTNRSPFYYTGKAVSYILGKQF